MVIYGYGKFMEPYRTLFEHFLVCELWINITQYMYFVYMVTVLEFSVFFFFKSSAKVPISLRQLNNNLAKATPHYLNHTENNMHSIS